MTLGDVNPQARGVSAAVHESTEGGGYLVIVFGGKKRSTPC